MHYKGQTFELAIALKGARLHRSDIAELEEAFGQEHERTYGHRAKINEPVELVNIQVVGHGMLDRPTVPKRLRSGRTVDLKRPASRRAYFGPESGWLDSPVLFRSDLTNTREGPCIIEEYDATCLVLPRSKVSLDGYGNIVIDV
jgi:N-methylhydantoinase A